MKLKPQTSLAIAILSILLTAPTHARADAVSDWNGIALQTISASVPARPGPITFVDMALVQVAVYDAVQAIERQYKPYHADIPGASGSSAVAAAKAAHDMLVNLFPLQTASLDNTYYQYLSDHSLSPLDPGAAVGAAAALDIINLRANDGRFPPGQVPFVGGTNPGEWRPTESFIGAPPAPPTFAAMATPWLGRVTPFTLKSADQYRAAPPPPLTSHEYTEAYDEVKAMGGRFNSLRTPEQTDLALFWAANYSVLWNNVVQGIVAEHVDNISDSSRLFALVNLAMGDAIITAWDTKNTYVFWRPLTAIRLGNDDTNPDTEGNPTWQPLINTPNYPDHSSGANNVTAAATRSLALFFGTDDMTFSVRTSNGAAIQQTRTYDRFSEAAAEVVVARIYEGIHFRFADEDAGKQGRHVAQWAFGHFLKPLE
jgi:hypothetical protein